MFKHGSILGAALGIGIGALGVPLAREHNYGRTRYPKGWKNVGKGGYRPHQGQREVSRRLLQRARDEFNQLARGERNGIAARLSRRGRVIG